jgi:hypothetical protein
VPSGAIAQRIAPFTPIRCNALPLLHPTVRTGLLRRLPFQPSEAPDGNLEVSTGFPLPLTLRGNDGRDGVNVGALQRLSMAMLALVGACCAHVGGDVGGAGVNAGGTYPRSFRVWQDALRLGSWGGAERGRRPGLRSGGRGPDRSAGWPYEPWSASRDPGSGDGASGAQPQRTWFKGASDAPSFSRKASGGDAAGIEVLGVGSSE